MPNVIVTCVFNPPTISIQGASIRQDTIDALQRALPKQTTTSLPNQRPREAANFLLTNGGHGGDKASQNAAAAGGSRAEGGPTAGAAEESANNNISNNSTGSNAGDAAEANGGDYKSWRIDLGQHYCDQKGRAMIFLVIMEAMEEEGFALRGTHAVVTEREKDVTRLIFSRS